MAHAVEKLIINALKAGQIGKNYVDNIYKFIFF